MVKFRIVSFLFLTSLSLIAVLAFRTPGVPLLADRVTLADSLREVYSRPSALWPAPHVDSNIKWEELAPLPDNPFIGGELDPHAELGKRLFFDPRLSVSGQISCGSCHDPEFGWSNGRTVSVGHDHQVGQRNASSLLNVWAMEEVLFWDGSVSSLEEQVFSPIANPVEMHQDTERLPEKIQEIKGYVTRFEEVFGDTAVTLPRIAAALAAFERTIRSKKSRFDLFMEGHHDVLSDDALLGLHLFRTKARCMNCHYGTFFTDFDFHNLGLHYYGRGKYEDWGRYHVTKDPEDIGKFKTPSLRDVTFTGPWMHNGLMWTLDGVINLYDHGGSRPKPREHVKDDPNFPETSDLLKPLNLTAKEKQALIAFLESISSVPYRMPRPDLPGMEPQ